MDNMNDIFGFTQLEAAKNSPEGVGKVVVKIFDFDNTLFRSPVPNVALWGRSYHGKLVSDLKTGGLGWWQSLITMDPAIINTEDWIDETVLDVQKAMPVLNEFKVMLTGRNTSFYGIIRKMLDERGLLFNAYGLKPMETTLSTLDFKYEYIQEVLKSLSDAGYFVSDVEMWEDRREHIGKFTKFLGSLGLSSYDIHHVSGGEKCLPEEKEKDVVEVLKANYLARNPGATLPEVQYFALVLDEVSRENLFARGLPVNESWKKIGHHMTLVPPAKIALNSGAKTFALQHEGEEFVMLVTEIGRNETNLAVKVQCEVPSTNAIPHITVATTLDGRAKDSNAISEWVPLESPFIVHGKIRAIYNKSSTPKSATPKKKALGTRLLEKYPETLKGRKQSLAPIISVIQKNGWDLDTHSQDISNFIDTLHS